MKYINPDDPKWTAYVLGELSDSERAAVEAELEASEEARMLVEELRFAADLTKMELRQAMPVVPLSREQRESIHAAAGEAHPRRWFGWRPPIWAAGLAAASLALIVLTVTLAPRLRRSGTPMSDPAPGPIAQAEQPQQFKEAAPTPEPVKQASDFGLRYEHPGTPPAALQLNKSKLTQSKTAETAVDDAAQVAPGAPLAPAAPPTVAAAPAGELVVSATGRISGAVHDSSGALIPGVDVTATNAETGVARTVVTNESGAYAFEGLRPGSYRVAASLPGFQTAISDGIQVAGNAQANKDITLQVAAISQSMEVRSQANALSNTSADGVGAITGAAGRGAARGGTAGAARDARVERAANEAAKVEQQGQQAQGRADFEAPNARLGFASPPPPPDAAEARRSVVIDGVSRIPRAPGVPPESDRVRPRVYNGTEAYDAIVDNPFLPVTQNPLSTFSIDVDTASYSNMRRYLNQNQLPPRDAVRIEEMINYFSYDYPQPEGNNPVGALIDAAAAPWNPQHRLVRIGIKARDIDMRRRPPSNLVFLLDVSGSMQPPERLPLIKEGMRMLVEQLTANDRVTVVTYAGTTGIALRATRGDQKDVIIRLIDSLQAGGSTNGASGIQLAYEQAAANFIQGGANRVILATDGDFNVGMTNRDALLRLIEEKAKSGVFLSVLGVGMGNYKDATLEMLADKGNGNFAYLDTLNEAKKVLVDQMSGTLVTMAKDVKVQVEFNPAVVDAYRLIGYENRALRNEDFNNDLKDAGDMGAGQRVTILYEVAPRGVGINAPGTPGIDPLKYQQPAPAARPATPVANASNETLTVKIRYKEPAANDSKLLEFPLVDREQTFARAAVDFRFAAAVASFGMILRDSPYKGTATIDSVLRMAEDSRGSDRDGYRREFLQLVQRARQIRN